MNKKDYKIIFNNFPKDVQVDNKKTIESLKEIYNKERKGQKPFYKYQIKLMKDILKYIEYKTRTTNARFINVNLFQYNKIIINHFAQTRGYKWQRVDDSLSWLINNLKY